MDQLLARGATCVSVLDLSGAALARARARLGPVSRAVRWIEADVIADWTVPPVDIWHDRAAYHFLTEPGDRQRYRAHMVEAVRPGGQIILATFALDGPERCSGLPVVRYSVDMLAEQLGPEFSLMETFLERHRTPRGGDQSFCWARFRRVSEARRA